MEIKAVNEYWYLQRPYIFLCGSIEMGVAENWQEKVVRCLPDYTILNPRREDWDSSCIQDINNPKFREQVIWELDAQRAADLILVHFEPDTKSPITLLELGLFHDKCIVHCPEGYWRKGNVDIVCRYFKITQVDKIDELIVATKRF